MGNDKETALCYPYIDINDAGLIKTSALYWDEVQTIVPDDKIQKGHKIYNTEISIEAEKEGFLKARIVNATDEVLLQDHKLNNSARTKPYIASQNSASQSFESFDILIRRLYTAAGSLQRLLKKTSCGFHNASPKSLALFLGVLALDVFEVSPAKFATERVDVKVDVPVPFVVKSAKQICPNSASFEATEPLKFPDIRQQVLEVYGGRANRDACACQAEMGPLRITIYPLERQAFTILNTSFAL